MEKINHIFRNQGLGEYNDDVYKQQTFDLIDNEFYFTIRPSSETKFWRFGFALSRTEIFDFSPEKGRYNNTDLRFIEIDVGVRDDNKKWQSPDVIAIGSYYIEGFEGKPQVKKGYKEFSEVNISLIRLTNGLVYANYLTENIEDSVFYHLPEFKFFKTFAWADDVQFELDCDIEFLRNSGFDRRDDISFSIGNVVFRLGDLFDNNSLQQGDLIVLPAASSGKVQPSIDTLSKNFNIPPPKTNSPGVVEIYNIPNARNPSLWSWAYSVESSKGSNQSIIRAVCVNLVSQLSQRNLRAISLPLLGTGAGGLRPTEVAEIYNSVFNNSEIKFKILVSLNTNEKYEAIKSYFENKQRIEGVQFQKSNLSFRDKKSVDGVLGVKDIAQELADIVKKMPDERGTMIGIFGRWGRGKTFLIEETWNLLKTNPDKERVDFHAWKFQDTPGIWAYLYEQFSSVYFKKELKWYDRLIRSIRLNFSRLGLTDFILFALPFIFSLYLAFWVSLSEKINMFLKIVGFIGIGYLINIIIMYFRFGSSARDLFKKYYSRVSFVKLLGIQAEVQKELESLLNVWMTYTNNERIVLIVEDIDRCSEDVIMQIIDALRVLLEDDRISKQIIVIVAIDERILHRAIKSKYMHLMQQNTKNYESELNELTKEYIDKLFMVGLKLGNISARERDEFFISFTKNDRESEDVENFDEDDIISKNNRRNEEVVIGYDLKGVFYGEERDSESTSIIPSIDESEKSPRDQQTKESSNNIQPDSKRFEKLSGEEFKTLRHCLKIYDNSTPRQIRIFYYRYLIAKNLLIKQYEKLNRKNIWMTPEYSKIMMSLIIVYSEQEKYELITGHKVDVLQTNAPKIKAFLLDNVSIDTLDYRELLKVLDIVIAY